MMNFKPFILIIITIARLTVINSKTSPTCKCTDFVNSSGQGNCQNSNTPKSDDKLCYVMRPSNCPDLKNSSLYQDKQISREACELNNQHFSFKNSGVKIRETSSFVLLSILIELTLSQGVVIII